jgi:2-oxoisovalerate dehydrogenase E1 component
MIDNKYIKDALIIRRTENLLLELAHQDKISGPVHTCNGQEFSAIAFCSSIQASDIVYSNHRCHGHYIALSGDVRGLIAELMGKASGVCGGIGASQHLYKKNFFSNGIQGGMVSVAAGMALAMKRRGNKGIVLAFIGDGTLGEGIVYETLNLATLLGLPLLLICENNQYAQSTKITNNLAGSIIMRAEAFGIKTYHSNTWHIEELFTNAKNSIEYTRSNGPAFHLVDTYRLNYHSRSDDKRNIDEVNHFSKIDPLNIFAKNNIDDYKSIIAAIDIELSRYTLELSIENEISPNAYLFEIGDYQATNKKWKTVELINESVANRINYFFDFNMKKGEDIIFIGEDVLSPYNGAFKVAKGLSEKYPDKVISTPISEAAITGLSNGLALSGIRPYLEIMFGDFVTLSFDQIVNHASKFYHMYNKQVNCPIVIRTPMGGGMGFGPTHSQTMDKFLVGIDNISVVAINSIIDPFLIYTNIHKYEKHPVIVIENKSDYENHIGIKTDKSYKLQYSQDRYPNIKLSPVFETPTLTIVSYGGIARNIIESIKSIAIETGFIPEFLVLTLISPLDVGTIIISVRSTKRLIVVEEGSKSFGIGAEIIAQVIESLGSDVILARRVGALAVPIPASSTLENIVLPNVRLVHNIKNELKSAG